MRLSCIVRAFVVLKKSNIQTLDIREYGNLSTPPAHHR